jgi:hypothetical protein
VETQGMACRKAGVFEILLRIVDHAERVF